MKFQVLAVEDQTRCLTVAFEDQGGWKISIIHDPHLPNGDPMDMSQADDLIQYLQEYGERYYPDNIPSSPHALIKDDTFIWNQVDNLRGYYKELASKGSVTEEKVVTLITDLLMTMKEMHVLCRTPWYRQWWYWVQGWPEDRVVDEPTPRIWHKLWNWIHRS